jgi:predicted metalloprotease with PDZ domain
MSQSIWQCLLFTSVLMGAATSSLKAQESTPPKPYLGVIVEDVEGGGLVVVDVVKESPAGTAGIRPADMIESINGIAVKSTMDMGAAMKGTVIGDKLRFVVSREGKSVNAEVTLIAAPEGAAAGGVEVEKVKPSKEDPEGALTPLPDPDAGIPSAPSNVGPARPYLGLTVVPASKGGAAISSIRKDSPAAKVGFPLGGVIIRVNDTPVDNPDDLINFIASMEPGASIELSYMHNERLYRKQVKLSSIGGSAVTGRSEPEVVSPPPAPTPRAGAPAVREDRPILSGIGRVLGAVPAVPAEPSARISSTQEQIDQLVALVAALEDRIAKLEAELSAMKSPKLEETPAPPSNPLP